MCFFSLYCPFSYFGHLQKWGRVLPGATFARLSLSCFVWVPGITLVTSTVLLQSPTTERNTFSSSGFHQTHKALKLYLWVQSYRLGIVSCVVGDNVSSLETSIFRLDVKFTKINFCCILRPSISIKHEGEERKKQTMIHRSEMYFCKTCQEKKNKVFLFIHFFPWANAAGCLERSWSFHPWRYSESIWTCPGQLALSHPTWAGGLEQMTSKDTLQLWPLCDSVNNRHNLNLIEIKGNDCFFFSIYTGLWILLYWKYVQLTLAFCCVFASLLLSFLRYQISECHKNDLLTIFLNQLKL